MNVVVLRNKPPFAQMLGLLLEATAVIAVHSHIVRLIVHMVEQGANGSLLVRTGLVSELYGSVNVTMDTWLIQTSHPCLLGDYHHGSTQSQ